MTLRWRSRHWLLTLLCVTLLAGRMDGAHLHLCLDGQEQSSSVRMGPDTPNRADTQAPHNDVDLALAGELLRKPGKGDLKQPLALPTAEVAILLTATRFEPLPVPTGRSRVVRSAAAQKRALTSFGTFSSFGLRSASS